MHKHIFVFLYFPCKSLMLLSTDISMWIVSLFQQYDFSPFTLRTVQLTNAVDFLQNQRLYKEYCTMQRREQ